MPALSDLIVPLTKDQVTATQLNLLTLAGFPVTSWQVGSVPRTLLDVDAATLADWTNTISLIAQGGLIDLATGPWLYLLATSHYQITPKPSVVTQGTITLTDAGNGGPYNIVPNQLWVGTADGRYRYNTTSSGVLPKGGTVQLAVQAESAGASYNLANGAITAMLTPLAGVGVSNPDPGGGTWISQQGADAEGDPSVRIRCKAQWPGLGGGATALVYQGWSLTAAPTVTRVNVLENTPTGGQVQIYCAGSNGASSATDVATVNAYIQTRRPLCVAVNVAAAQNVVTSIVATVSVQTARIASAQSAFVTALNLYSAALPVGAPVYLSKVIDLFMQLAGVTNVTGTSLNGSAADLTLSSNQVPVFTISGITWAGV